MQLLIKFETEIVESIQPYQALSTIHQKIVQATGKLYFVKIYCMKKILLLAFPFILFSCSNDDEKKQPEPLPQSPLALSNNSEAFNKSFALILSNYYALKDAFVKEDTIKVTAAAAALKTAADSVKLGELKADAAIVETAKLNAQNLSDELKGLLGENGIENKRKSFVVVSSDVYDLVRVVHYDREKVYMQHCPMAFNNKGADWLSNVAEIENPYIPKKMLDCGEIKDSVDFRPKK